MVQIRKGKVERIEMYRPNVDEGNAPPPRKRERKEKIGGGGGGHSPHDRLRTRVQKSVERGVPCNNQGFQNT